MKVTDFLFEQIQELTFQKFSDEVKSEFEKNIAKYSSIKFDTEIKKRQLNELLLFCNENRVSNSFFNYFTSNKGCFIVRQFPELIE